MTADGDEVISVLDSLLTIFGEDTLVTGAVVVAATGGVRAERSVDLLRRFFRSWSRSLSLSRLRERWERLRLSLERERCREDLCDGLELLRSSRFEWRLSEPLDASDALEPERRLRVCFDFSTLVSVSVSCECDLFLLLFGK